MSHNQFLYCSIRSTSDTTSGIRLHIEPTGKSDASDIRVNDQLWILFDGDSPKLDYSCTVTRDFYDSTLGVRCLRVYYHSDSVEECIAMQDDHLYQINKDGTIEPTPTIWSFCEEEATESSDEEGGDDEGGNDEGGDDDDDPETQLFRRSINIKPMISLYGEAYRSAGFIFSVNATIENISKIQTWVKTYKKTMKNEKDKTKWWNSDQVRNKFQELGVSFIYCFKQGTYL